MKRQVYYITYYVLVGEECGLVGQVIMEEREDVGKVQVEKVHYVLGHAAQPSPALYS